MTSLSRNARIDGLRYLTLPKGTKLGAYEILAPFGQVLFKGVDQGLARLLAHNAGAEKGLVPSDVVGRRGRVPT
jgi:hypothetical protein